MSEIFMTVVLFNGIVMLLVGLILVVRRVVVGSGVANITIEGHAPIRALLGLKLNSVLTNAGIPILASCGGRGTCGLCRVRVTGKVDPPLATEVALVDAHALARNVRLSCQVTVRGDLEVGLLEGLPAQVFETKVTSTRNLTPLIKEITLAIPDGVPFDFRAGSFVQITCPAYRLRLADVAVDDAVRTAWETLGVGDLVAFCESDTTRAYSLANHPAEGRIAMLVVRLALPPPDAPAGTPPGVVSSYIFGLAPGDAVMMTGPFGHFVANDSSREMIFIGGGAGMAPMRAHVFEQLEVLKTDRTVSFWYGARTKSDLFYSDEFDRLAAAHPNFRWSVALSEPAPHDEWHGPTGFIHQHVHDAYLADHPSPSDCEYYLCGPPLMVRSVVAMLDRLGVPEDNIFYDDFGG